MPAPVLRLLAKSGLFALPLLLAFAALEWRLSAIPNSYAQKRAILERLAPSVEVVVTGNSHELFGVVPEELACEEIPTQATEHE